MQQRLRVPEKAEQMQAISQRFDTQTVRLKRLVGAPGFEPGNGGIKIRCLTTWLRPNSRKGRNLLKIGPGSMPE
jgi:hypothetical protein